MNPIIYSNPPPPLMSRKQMKLKALCSPGRETQVLTWIYMIQLILISAVSGMAGYRIIAPDAIKRGPTGLIIGVATLANFFIQYILLTTRVKFFKRWANLRAFVILNVITCIAWALVGGFTVVNLGVEGCKPGSDCALTGVTLGLIAPVLLLSMFAAYFSTHQLSNSKVVGNCPPEDAHILPIKD